MAKFSHDLLFSPPIGMVTSCLLYPTTVLLLVSSAVRLAGMV